MIGERMRESRLNKGITLVEMSELLNKKTGINLSQATLSKYETGGIKTIPQGNMVAIAEVLDVSVQYLMGWVDESKEIKILKNLYKKTEKHEMVWKTLNNKNISEQYSTILHLIDLNKSFFNIITEGEMQSGILMFHLLNKQVIEANYDIPINKISTEGYELVLVIYSPIGAYYFTTNYELNPIFDKIEGLDPYPTDFAEEVSAILKNLNKVLLGEEKPKEDQFIDYIDDLLKNQKTTGRIERNNDTD